MALENVRLRPDVVPLQWHEAVTVVQAVAKQLLAAGESGPVPTAAGLAVDPDGAVHVVDSPRTGLNGDGPAGLAALLGELLRSSSFVPAALNSLADEPSPFGSVEDFINALRFFERPMSRHDMAALAARLATNQEQRHLNAELEHLTQKARVAEVQPNQQSDGPDRRSGPRRRKAAIAALGVAFVVLAMFVAALAGGARMEPMGLREAGSKLVERLSSEAKAVLRSDPQPSPSGQAAPSAARPPRAERLGALRPRQPAALPPLAVIDLSRVTAVGVAEAVEPLAKSAAANVEANEQPSAHGAYIVYSRADVDVEPPVLFRPQLRSDPPDNLRPDKMAVIEVVVDEHGGVSQVRVSRVSVEQRYYAAMLVAAAKAWKFRPALRAGKPVRYHLQFGLIH
jgi:hypothetical protein